ncbi:MAG: 50S ribosomal protein L17 [Atribacterota bacterium]|nr:50S ribosomal protein L17 [Atribacterota bacterium]MDD4896853.1 50S ribosomal protein L17 [Atribacterota bacterium]MDD5636403.1 50S ribosomal protein L17 [Atribacterota bacterium]
MRHRILKRKLNVDTSHRKALLSNLAISMIIYRKINTTLPKAKELQKYLEKIVTIAKEDNLQAKRQVFKILQNKQALKLLFEEISPQFRERNGGYTRIIKAGFRKGDSSPMAIIEFVK